MIIEQAATAVDEGGGDEQHPTTNDLPSATRAKMCELLNARVADAIDLGLQAKQAHWNVKGPMFFSLRELFDEVADAVREFTDEMAERIAQLGGIAEGSLAPVRKRTALQDYPLDAVDGVQHLVRARALRSAPDHGSDDRRERTGRPAAVAAARLNSIHIVYISSPSRPGRGAAGRTPSRPLKKSRLIR